MILDGVGQELYDFEDAMRQVRARLVSMYPLVLAAVQANPNPHASVAYHVYVHFERLLLNSMTEAVCHVVSFEHDGLVARGDPTDHLRLATAAAGMRLTIKPMPSDPVAALRLKFPHHDWDIVAKLSDVDLVRARAECEHYLSKKAARVRANNLSFVDFVFHRVSDMVYVPFSEGEKHTHYERFNPTRRTWTTRHRADLIVEVQERAWGG